MGWEGADELADRVLDSLAGEYRARGGAASSTSARSTTLAFALWDADQVRLTPLVFTVSRDDGEGRQKVGTICLPFEDWTTADIMS